MKANRLSLMIFSLISVSVAYCIYYLHYYTGFTMFFMAFASVFAILFLISFFVNRETFYSWIKFSSIWVIVSLVVVASIPEYGDSAFFPGPGRKFFAWLMAAIFLLISLILIARGWWKTRDKVVN